MNLNLKLFSSERNPISHIHAVEHADKPALLTIDSKGIVTTLDPILGTELARLELKIDCPINSSAVISSHLIMGGDSGVLTIIDLKTGDIIKTEQICQGSLISIANMSGDGCAIGSDNGLIFYCKLRPFAVQKIIEIGMSVLFLHQISDRQLLLIAESNVLVTINIATSEVEHISKIGHSAVTAAIYDNGIFYFGCTFGNLHRVDLKAHIKDPKSTNMIAKKVHSSWILSMKLIRNYLITTGDDKIAVVWNPSNLEAFFVIKSHANSVQAVEEVANCFFTASHDGTIMFESVCTLGERIKSAEEARLAQQKQREMELEKEKEKKKKKVKNSGKAKTAKKK